MSEDRTGGRQAPEQREQDRMLHARTPRRSEAERASGRKPTPAERGEWRGSGVCGDSHTD